jgi:hypothetical protein
MVFELRGERYSQYGKHQNDGQSALLRRLCARLDGGPIRRRTSAVPASGIEPLTGLRRAHRSAMRRARAACRRASA